MMARQVTASVTRIITAEAHTKAEHTEYIVTCQFPRGNGWGTQVWERRTRYSEFEEWIHKDLKGISLPPLPRKHLFRSMWESVKKERADAMTKILRALLPEHQENRSVVAFLGLQQQFLECDEKYSKPDHSGLRQNRTNSLPTAVRASSPDGSSKSLLAEQAAKNVAALNTLAAQNKENLATVAAANQAAGLPETLVSGPGRQPRRMMAAAEPLSPKAREFAAMI